MSLDIFATIMGLNPRGYSFGNDVGPSNKQSYLYSNRGSLFSTDVDDILNSTLTGSGTDDFLGGIDLRLPGESSHRFSNNGFDPFAALILYTLASRSAEEESDDSSVSDGTEEDNAPVTQTPNTTGGPATSTPPPTQIQTESIPDTPTSPSSPISDTPLSPPASATDNAAARAQAEAQAKAQRMNEMTAHQNTGWDALQRGDNQIALTEWNAWKQMDEQYNGGQTNANGLIDNGLMVVKRNLGDYAGAIADGERAVQKNPNSADFRTNLGLSYSLSGNHAAAEAHLRHAANLAPQDSHVRLVLADALFRAGNYAACAAECNQALTSNPNDPGINRLKGIALREAGDYNGSVQALQLAVANATSNDQKGDCEINLAVTLMLAGRRQEAIQVGASALQKNNSQHYQNIYNWITG